WKSLNLFPEASLQSLHQASSKGTGEGQVGPQSVPHFVQNKHSFADNEHEKGHYHTHPAPGRFWSHSATRRATSPARVPYWPFSYPGQAKRKVITILCLLGRYGCLIAHGGRGFAGRGFADPYFVANHSPRLSGAIRKSPGHIASQI